MQITKVFAQGFKGATWAEPLSRLNLVIGPNGAGKSARAQALQLAILGYLPADQKKKTDAIFETHAATGADSFTVGIEVADENGKADGLARVFRRAADGSHSASVFRAGHRKVPAKGLDLALKEIGSPAIFDLRAWLDLSDQKKVAHLFDLFPPTGSDPAAIEAELEAAARAESAAKRDIDGVNDGMGRAILQRNTLKLPAGSLAEIDVEIAELTEQLRQAQENVKALDVAEAEERGREEAARPDPVRAAPSVASSAPLQADPRVSLETVQRTMQAAGCSACAAQLVLKRELKKFPLSVASAMPALQEAAHG